MYEVTDRYRAEIRKSHTVYTRAEIWTQGELLADNVPILSGTVTDDRTALVRRRTNFTMTPGKIKIPGAVYDDSPLWPVGNNVRIWMGVKYDDGVTEEVPQGIFRLSKPTITKGLVTVDAYDLSRTVNRAKFTDFYVINQGSNYGAAIKAVLQHQCPWLTEDKFGGFDLVPYSTPTLIFSPGDNPWERAVEMARSFGYEIFFDVEGNIVLRPEPNVFGQGSVFDYFSGEAQMLTDVSRDLDDEEAYNGAIVIGQTTENSTVVPRGESWDLDPNSATYYDPTNPTASRYGPHPYVVTSDFVVDDSQAREASRALLMGVLGILESVQFTGIVNAAQQSSDVIGIQDEGTGIDDVYMLESVTLGYGPQGDMTGSTRTRRAA